MSEQIAIVTGATGWAAHVADTSIHGGAPRLARRTFTAPALDANNDAWSTSSSTFVTVGSPSALSVEVDQRNGLELEISLYLPFLVCFAGAGQVNFRFRKDGIQFGNEIAVPTGPAALQCYGPQLLVENLGADNGLHTIDVVWRLVAGGAALLYSKFLTLPCAPSLSVRAG